MRSSASWLLSSSNLCNRPPTNRPTVQHSRLKVMDDAVTMDGRWRCGAETGALMYRINAPSVDVAESVQWSSLSFPLCPPLSSFRFRSRPFAIPIVRAYRSGPTATVVGSSCFIRQVVWNRISLCSHRPTSRLPQRRRHSCV